MVWLEVWDAAFSRLDLGSPLAETKVKAREVCWTMRKVQTEKSRERKRQGGGGILELGSRMCK